MPAQHRIEDIGRFLVAPTYRDDGNYSNVTEGRLDDYATKASNLRASTQAVWILDDDELEMIAKVLNFVEELKDGRKFGENDSRLDVSWLDIESDMMPTVREHWFRHDVRVAKFLEVRHRSAGRIVTSDWCKSTLADSMSNEWLASQDEAHAYRTAYMLVLEILEILSEAGICHDSSAALASDDIVEFITGEKIQVKGPEAEPILRWCSYFGINDCPKYDGFEAWRHFASELYSRGIWGPGVGKGLGYNHVPMPRMCWLMASPFRFGATGEVEECQLEKIDRARATKVARIVEEDGSTNVTCVDISVERTGAAEWVSRDSLVMISRIAGTRKAVVAGYGKSEIVVIDENRRFCTDLDKLALAVLDNIVLILSRSRDHVLGAIKGLSRELLRDLWLSGDAVWRNVSANIAYPWVVAASRVIGAGCSRSTVRVRGELGALAAEAGCWRTGVSRTQCLVRAARETAGIPTAFQKPASKMTRNSKAQRTAQWSNSESRPVVRDLLAMRRARMARSISGLAGSTASAYSADEWDRRVRSAHMLSLTIDERGRGRHYGLLINSNDRAGKCRRRGETTSGAALELPNYMAPPADQVLRSDANRAHSHRANCCGKGMRWHLTEPRYKSHSKHVVRHCQNRIAACCQCYCKMHAGIGQVTMPSMDITRNISARKVKRKS